MIDEGETDWKVKLQMCIYINLNTNTIKVMAIDVNDPLAENLNDIQDVDKIMPGFLKVRRMLCLNSPYPLQVVSTFRHASVLKYNSFNSGKIKVKRSKITS